MVQSWELKLKSIINHNSVSKNLEPIRKLIDFYNILFNKYFKK